MKLEVSRWTRLICGFSVMQSGGSLRGLEEVIYSEMGYLSSLSWFSNLNLLFFFLTRDTCYELLVRSEYPHSLIRPLLLQRGHTGEVYIFGHPFGKHNQ